ncbi:MAG: hypothetical protein GY847_33545 [Proteobacteria bacterium]|nr:hypothetical protein [Pseudomonadota bacterium]
MSENRPFCVGLSFTYMEMKSCRRQASIAPSPLTAPEQVTIALLMLKNG